MKLVKMGTDGFENGIYLMQVYRRYEFNKSDLYLF